MVELEHDSEGDVKKAAWLLSLFLLAAAGCGPITATQALSRAEQSLKAAEAAGADVKCPYEHTAAVAYLNFAREREGMSEFEAAVMFANKSSSISEQAGKLAALTADGKQAQLDSGAFK